MEVAYGEAAVEDGVPVRMWTDGGGKNQRWRFVSIRPAPFRIFRLEACHSFKCLETVTDPGVREQSSRVQQGNYAGRLNQHWYVVSDSLRRPTRWLKLVAAVGTYGVLSYSVSQRTKELGLRMALGADRGGVLALVLREGLTVGVVGLAAGVTAAAELAQVLSSLVFGVSVHDPASYLAVSALLLVIASLACAVPAIRASHVDPMTALRLD